MLVLEKLHYRLRSQLQETSLMMPQVTATAIAPPTLQSHNSHINKRPPTLAQKTVGQFDATTQSHKEAIAHSPRETLTRKVRYVIAQVLTWDTQRDVSADEVETISINHDILWVKLTDNRAIPIHVEAFRAIRRQQLEQLAKTEADIDLKDVLRQSAFSSDHLLSAFDHCEPNSEHYAASSDHCENSSEHLITSSEHCNQNDIEVDSDDQPVTPAYRVWSSFNLIGTFHQSLVDNKWLTNPVYGCDYNRHNTSDEAIKAIVDAWNCAQQLRSTGKGLLKVIQ